MQREPKVACVETNCVWAPYSKNCIRCKKCKPRYIFADAIERGDEIASLLVPFGAGREELDKLFG